MHYLTAVTALLNAGCRAPQGQLIRQHALCAASGLAAGLGSWFVLLDERGWALRDTGELIEHTLIAGRQW